MMTGPGEEGSHIASEVPHVPLSLSRRCKRLALDVPRWFRAVCILFEPQASVSTPLVRRRCDEDPFWRQMSDA